MCIRDRVNLLDHIPEADTDAANAAWFSLDDLPTLAFDHKDILKIARERLQGKVRYQPIGFELLPKKFTMFQLQTLYECVLEQELDKRNFRKKFAKLNILKETNEVERDVARRAARLYKFDRKRYQDLIRQGMNFEI